MRSEITDVLYEALIQARGDTWKQRGYGLVRGNSEPFDISGDFGQFYQDAVAADADAHLAVEFLRGSKSVWDDLVEYAEDDFIDIEESQKTFLMGKPLSVHIQALS